MLYKQIIWELKKYQFKPVNSTLKSKAKQI